MPGRLLVCSPWIQGAHTRVCQSYPSASHIIHLGILDARERNLGEKASQQESGCVLRYLVGGKFSRAPIRENGSMCLSNCPQDLLGHRSSPPASLFGGAVGGSSELGGRAGGRALAELREPPAVWPQASHTQVSVCPLNSV